MNKEPMTDKEIINQLTDEFLKIVKVYYPDKPLTWINMVNIHLDILQNLEKKMPIKVSS